MAGRKRKFPGKFRTPILPLHLLILYMRHTLFSSSSLVIDDIHVPARHTPFKRQMPPNDA
jgi:hypothetical protein